MLKRIVHFIQYHNFFTIAVMFLFVGASATFAANPETVIQKTETVRSVDNTFVVNTDFDAYDMGLQINAVTEDTELYYVEYTYNTVEVQDYVWKPIPLKGAMKVSKKELAGRDLGVYVAEQLGQMVTQQVAFLKEVQNKEKKVGATQKVVAVEYSGLVGRFLEAEEKHFEGYTPIKTPEPVQEEIAYAEIAAAAAAAANGVSTVSYGAPPAPSEKLLTQSEVQVLIQEAVQQVIANQNTTPQPVDTGAVGNTPAPSPVVTPTEETATTTESIPEPPAETLPAEETATTTLPLPEITPVEVAPEPVPESVTEPAPEATPAPEPVVEPAPEPTPAPEPPAEEPPQTEPVPAS